MSADSLLEISVAFTNQLPVELVVYLTTSATPVSNPPSTSPSAYAPVYTVLGTVPANGTATLNTGTLSSRLVIARQSDTFPVKLFSPDPMGAMTQAVTVQASDLANLEACWSFYKFFVSQPYAPLSLQVNAVLLNNPNPATIETNVTSLIAASYPGADYYGFSMIGYWANNSLQAWPGTYYAYMPSALTANGLIAPSVMTGILTIANGAASYAPPPAGSASEQAQLKNIENAGGLAASLAQAVTPGGGVSYPQLYYSGGQLASALGTSTSGLCLTGVYRTMTWEGEPSQTGMFWIGTLNGQQIVLQPYQNYSLPWWIYAYDAAFTAYLTVQVVMMLDMASHVLSGVASGAEWLSNSITSLISGSRTAAQGANAAADADASAGAAADPVNVDVDVDVDVDIDTDIVTDSVSVSNTDVDVDIDIDIDIDDDVFAVIDVDVDVDVDIDTDSVADTDNVTDTDVDVDVDVDTDTNVNVPPGGLRAALSAVGSYLSANAGNILLGIAKNGLIMGAMWGAGKLLSAWQTSDEEAISPQESTGTGLLINYMLTPPPTPVPTTPPTPPVDPRWTTFAEFVQQSQASVTTQQTMLATLLMAGNTAADSANKAWKWPQGAEPALLKQMQAYPAGAQQYEVYSILAAYQSNKEFLPIKVAAGVALQYLSQLS